MSRFSDAEFTIRGQVPSPGHIGKEDYATSLGEAPAGGEWVFRSAVMSVKGVNSLSSWENTCSLRLALSVVGDAT
jgi:hypothetical protein